MTVITINKDRAKAAHVAQVRAERDRLIGEVQWRYERHAREVRLGLEPSDDIKALDAYVQALADVPKQKGFPGKVKWPVLAG